MGPGRYLQGPDGYQLGYHEPGVTRADYADPMETPTASEATDRLGNKLPASPTAEQIEEHADRLRVIPDTELPIEALERISEDDLERRRSQALSK